MIASKSKKKKKKADLHLVVFLILFNMAYTISAKSIHYLPMKSLAFPISLSHTVISRVFLANSLCLMSYINSCYKKKYP